MYMAWIHPGSQIGTTKLIISGSTSSRRSCSRPYRFGGFSQHLDPQGQHGAEPARVRGVVGVVIAGLGMKEDGQPVAVEHQPRQERSSQIGRKGDLIHRLGM